MDQITMIVVLSSVIWILVDRFKTIWANLSFGKYITSIVAAALGAAVTFCYGLDVICALGVSSEITIVGQIITILSITGGSSIINEIITKVKTKN